MQASLVLICPQKSVMLKIDVVNLARMNIKQPLERWPLVHMLVGSIRAFRAGMLRSSATKRGIVLIWCSRRVASAFGNLGMAARAKYSPQGRGQARLWWEERGGPLKVVSSWVLNCVVVLVCAGNLSCL